MDVSAAIFEKENRVLLMRRAPGHSAAGGWEYPGGKFEPGETGEECLRRELQEELHIDGVIGPLAAEYSRQTDRGELHLMAYRVLSWQGAITLTDHDRMEWVPLANLLEHDQLESDLEISRQLVQQAEVLADIRDRLSGGEEATYAAFQRKLIPNLPPETIHGVRTPTLRKLAKELLRSGAGETFLKLLPHESFEENQLHAFLLSEQKDFKRCLRDVEIFLPCVDNWATCDQLSPGVFKRNAQALLPPIRRWICSQRPYTIRFGVGMLMQHFLDQRFEPQYLDIVAAVQSEEYYVNMMLAWFFATALTKQYDSTLPYLEHRRLGRWVHNKTIQKAVESYRIAPDRKAYLKSLRRKER